ncbi:Hypothetical protein LLA12_00936 [Lactococcus lactis subsp. lactis]|nr:Hypothetical protein LLA12_00936 [Lactococcus lactis subsp. lactis]
MLLKSVMDWLGLYDAEPEDYEVL